MATTLDYNIDFTKYFYYDETSPTRLRWKVTIMKGKAKNLALVRKGEVAGTFRRNRDGKPSQIAVGLNGKSYRVHKIVYILFHGIIDTSKVIDHLDGNPWNNSINNLKEKSFKQNSENRGVSKNSPYGISGVTCEYQDPAFPSFRARLKTTDNDFHKSFSVMKFGLLPAFKMAVTWRQNKIEELNKLGASYTERHGK